MSAQERDDYGRTYGTTPGTPVVLRKYKACPHCGCAIQPAADMCILAPPGSGTVSR